MTDIKKRRTWSGHIVHVKTMDHLPTNNWYARMNKKVALALAKYIGSMTCFWVFCFISLMSLPAVLTLVDHSFSSIFPKWLIATSLVSLVAWISSNFLQLILLPALMVGQSLQGEAADIRSTKTFEDTETIIDKLKIDTDGGLKDAVDAITAHIDAVMKDK